jgi:hypothetical protein
MVILEHLDENELLSQLRSLPVSLQGLTLDELGEELALEYGGEERGFGFGGGLWERIKEQFRQLMCGHSDEYDHLRTQLQDACKLGTGALMATISKALATQVGIDAAAAAPLVAVLLLAAVRVGLGVICADKPLNSVVERPLRRMPREPARTDRKRANRGRRIQP